MKHLGNRTSINIRLTLIIISSFVLTLFLALLKGYETSYVTAEKQLDEQLYQLGEVLMHVPLAKWPEQSQLYSKRWSAQTEQFSADIFKAVPFETYPDVGAYTANLANKRLRIVVMKRDDDTLWLAQPVERRFELIESLIVSAMTPLVMITPMLALAIAWYIRRSLRPLTLLSKELQLRKANDFSQLSTISTDAEVAPVIERMNQLLTKVEAAYLRERYFASDAAHELKTPISSLKIHLHNLAEGQSESILALEQGVAQLNHIVEQMLTLARTEPESWHAQFKPIDILSFTQNLVSDLYEKIESKGQTIELDGKECVIFGCEFTLKTLLGNLLSNAIKYTPKGGVLALTLVEADRKVGWQLDDSGPGMTEEQIARVFDRFYRVGGDKHPSGEKGAGLGMAIVQQVVAIYDASIDLSRSHLGGLRVTVWFNKELV
ncbi:sensor histidine kinase [Pseudoalteromonas luteoviolacea B = ATCC 29581]|nr:sensor histidine kinase [Pseudoalteromonas luteoviolacea B = ATCC 29581]